MSDMKQEIPECHWESKAKYDTDALYSEIPWVNWSFSYVSLELWQQCLKEPNWYVEHKYRQFKTCLEFEQSQLKELYEKDAGRYNSPWQFWEVQNDINKPDDWRQLCHEPTWDSEHRYRRKVIKEKNMKCQLEKQNNIVLDEYLELHAAYKTDALNSNTPWDKWLWKTKTSHNWNDCLSAPLWHLSGYMYKRKKDNEYLKNDGNGNIVDTRNTGIKYDNDKPLMSLLSPWFIEEIANVLTVGAAKYGKDNWKLVSDGRARYTDATLRHLNSYLKGEQNDVETGISHLAHLATNLSFLYEFDRLEMNP